MANIVDMLLELNGIISARLEEGSLVVEVEAACFTNEWSYSRYDEKGKQLPRGSWRLIRIDDLRVIECVQGALDKLYPRTYARLAWDTELAEATATLRIRTEVKRALPYPAHTCPRCKGEGDYSYNQEDGSICYGCGAVKRVAMVKAAQARSLRDVQPGSEPVIYKWAQYQRLEDGSFIRLGDGATGRLDDKGNLVMDDPNDQLTPLLASMDEVLEYERQRTGREPRRSTPMPREYFSAKGY